MSDYNDAEICLEALRTLLDVGRDMQPWLIPLLICPKSGQSLSLRDPVVESDGEIISGALVTGSGNRYPIVGGIPRFVEHHYANAFGLQWNSHALTQIDNQSHRHSQERFWSETGFAPEGLKGRLGIDGGCGAGRFTKVAAEAGARIVAIDLSEAVEACYANNRGQDVCVVQASLYELPFAPETFDFAFTIGVIQHTPDPLGALRGVGRMVKQGGEIGVWWYKKYWLRPLFRLMDDKTMYRFIQWYVPKLLPISRVLAHVLPYRDKAVVDRILPVANRDYVQGLTDAEKLEWAILDTYDWFQPHYDKPQSWAAVEGVLHELGFTCERSPNRREGLHCVRRRAAEAIKAN